MPCLGTSKSASISSVTSSAASGRTASVTSNERTVQPESSAPAPRPNRWRRSRARKHDGNRSAGNCLLRKRMVSFVTTAHALRRILSVLGQAFQPDNPPRSGCPARLNSPKSAGSRLDRLTAHLASRLRKHQPGVLDRRGGLGTGGRRRLERHPRRRSARPRRAGSRAVRRSRPPRRPRPTGCSRPACSSRAPRRCNSAGRTGCCSRFRRGFVQVLEVLAGFQLGIGLGHREEPADGRGEVLLARAALGDRSRLHGLPPASTTRSSVLDS